MSSIIVDVSDLEDVEADLVLAPDSRLEIIPTGVKVADKVLERVATVTNESFTFVSNGDTNGVLYRIGTGFGAQAWNNPDIAGFVTVTRSSSANGVDADIVDRATNYNTTQNDPGEWIAVDLGVNKLMIVSDYLVQNGAADGQNAPSNWKLQGSNDVADNTIPGINGATWVDIDTSASNTIIAQTVGAWGHFILGSVPLGYRWLRMIATGINQAGLNYLQVSELEFYGDLTYGGTFYDKSLAAFQSNSVLKPLDDDTSVPTNTVIPAGYIKFSAGGDDAWLPYYQ